MVHFPGLTRAPLCIQRAVTWFYQDGFPHSEIPGSKPACGSPRLIAACHVLLRLLAPRHPPYALSSLTIKLTQCPYPSRIGIPSDQREPRISPVLRCSQVHLRNESQTVLQAVYFAPRLRPPLPAPFPGRDRRSRRIKASSPFHIALLEQILRFCASRASRPAMRNAYFLRLSKINVPSTASGWNVSAPGGAPLWFGAATANQTLSCNKKPGIKRRAFPSFSRDRLAALRTEELEARFVLPGARDQSHLWSIKTGPAISSLPLLAGVCRHQEIISKSRFPSSPIQLSFIFLSYPACGIHLILWKLPGPRPQRFRLRQNLWFSCHSLSFRIAAHLSGPRQSPDIFRKKPPHRFARYPRSPRRTRLEKWKTVLFVPHPICPLHIFYTVPT
jgi:hypothetical protein